MHALISTESFEPFADAANDLSSTLRPSSTVALFEQYEPTPERPDVRSSPVEDASENLYPTPMYG